MTDRPDYGVGALDEIAEPIRRLNGDGYGDVVIGSTWAGSGGVVYVVYGTGL